MGLHPGGIAQGRNDIPASEETAVDGYALLDSLALCGSTFQLKLSSVTSYPTVN